MLQKTVSQILVDFFCHFARNVRNVHQISINNINGIPIEFLNIFFKISNKLYGWIAAILDTVRKVVEEGADIEAKDGNGQNLLQWAAYSGNDHWSNGNFIISKKNTNSTNKNKLNWNSGELEVVKYLLGKGANIESKDDHGMTPLLLSASEGSWKY